MKIWKCTMTGSSREFYGTVMSHSVTLTHSYLYHYWHIPTMVGFCHGGNMIMMLEGFRVHAGLNCFSRDSQNPDLSSTSAQLFQPESNQETISVVATKTPKCSWFQIYFGFGFWFCWRIIAFNCCIRLKVKSENSKWLLPTWPDFCPSEVGRWLNPNIEV